MRGELRLESKGAGPKGVAPFFLEGWRLVAQCFSLLLARLGSRRKAC